MVDRSNLTDEEKEQIVNDFRKTFYTKRHITEDKDLLDLIEKEGNEYKWINGKTGYECLIYRHETTGTWNGYVRIPLDHPLHDVSYNDFYEKDIHFDVHGGLTFSDRGIFGFDTSHYNDLMPFCAALPSEMGNIYRTKEYVIEETNKLAEQFKEYERSG